MVCKLGQPGLRVLAELDPHQTVSETNKGNNRYPAGGDPLPIDVRALPTFEVRLVPVLQQANGLTGNVTAGNLESFLADLRQVLPVGDYDADLRSVYTTTAPALQSGNGNNAWNTVLNELLALRSAEASSRYYYGVVKVPYSSGVAGMGYVGGSARTAMGWDYLPSGSNVLAHEVGHNMGRMHAPCGSVGGADPGYPHPGGTISAWGLHLGTLVLKSPTTPDVMGYCQPTWISDYNWTAMMEYRMAGPNNTQAAPGRGEGLLVWGRIAPDRIVLEPAFRVPLAPGSAPVPGNHQLELLDSSGAVLRTVRFHAPAIGDHSPERHFAFVVPAEYGSLAVAGLRVRSGALQAAAQGLPPGDPEASITRAGTDRIAVRWNAARYPMVLVRDAASGRVLSFARGGTATLWSRAADVDLQFSSGARTVSRRERLLR